MLRKLSPMLTLVIGAFLLGCGDKPGRELPKIPPADGKVFNRKDEPAQKLPKPVPFEVKSIDLPLGVRHQFLTEASQG